MRPVSDCRAPEPWNHSNEPAIFRADQTRASHSQPRVLCPSTRQFGRIFLSKTGESPAKALERLRLEAARNKIERGRYLLETIAREVGLRDGRPIREVFVRAFGTAPQSLRSEARSLPADENLVNG
ncbi:helix-turn-helix domain-containing protein [Paraburkholderia terrae]|uniref:helix-turn-helix domain-containing protein n=1 Tax=Paraburkholderia terrae TaxID=311230 RepID=UPI002FDD07B1